MKRDASASGILLAFFPTANQVYDAKKPHAPGAMLTLA